MSLSREQPPFDTAKPLSEYLQRKFNDIEIEFERPSKFAERKEMPYKARVGDIHYFGDPATHSYDAEITSEGFWGNTSTGWVKLHGGGNGLLTGEYRFSDSVAVAPASSYLRFDTGSYGTTTELFISDTTFTGGDATNFLAGLATGDQIYIQNTSDAGVFSVWDVSGAVTDEGSWFRIPVTAQVNGVFPSNNAKTTISLWFAP